MSMQATLFCLFAVCKRLMILMHSALHIRVLHSQALLHLAGAG